jgi:hypothetical protein
MFLIEMNHYANGVKDHGTYRYNPPHSHKEIMAIVRRQLPCPVGDNYLDRLTDM